MSYEEMWKKLKACIEAERNVCEGGQMMSLIESSYKKKECDFILRIMSDLEDMHNE